MSQVSLFRQEALDFHNQRHECWGEVGLLQPLPIKILFWCIIVVVFAGVIFLFLGQYARKETVAGYLVPTAGIAKVFAPRPGTVKAIHVAEGKVVSEGEPLLTVAVDQTTAEGENVDTAVLDVLDRQKRLLSQRIVLQEWRVKSEQRRLNAQIQGLANEIAQLETQSALQAERVGLSGNHVGAAEELRSRGYLSETEYRSRQAAHLEQKQSLEGLNLQIIMRRNQLTEARYALEQLPASMAQEIHSLQTQLSETEQRVAEIEGRRAYVVLAPVAGRVTSIQAVLGRTANPQQLQLSIVPVDSVLQAELFVPTRAAGFVMPNQRIRILYDAFPYQRYGTYSGRITKVAETVLTGGDPAGPIVLQEPAYKVTVELDRQEVMAHGRRMRLQADMLLRADIILDRRSLIDWFLEPLHSVRV